VIVASSDSTCSTIYEGWGDYGTTGNGITLKYRDTSARSCKISNNYYSVWEYEDNSTTSACDDWLTCKYTTGSASTATISWKQVARAMRNHAAACYGADSYLARMELQWYESGGVTPRKPEDRLKEIIQQRQAPAFLRSRTVIEPTEDIREVRARETLLRVLGQQKFRSFVKNGFVSVRAKSGLVYQIFPGHGITSVYRDGVKVERLCVVLKGRFPPTDSLIMRYLLILNDEQDFRSHAISHSVSQNRTTERQVDVRPLPEIYREIKKVA